MKIEAVLDSDYFKLGWDAHWKTLGWKRSVFPSFGILALVLAFSQLILIPDKYASTIMLFLIGFIFAFQSKIAAFHQGRNSRKHPNYGKAIHFSLVEPYFFIKVGDSEAKLNLNEILKIESSKDAILVYPQKNIYYILPLSSFVNKNAYDEFLSCIEGKYEKASAKSEQTRVVD